MKERKEFIILCNHVENMSSSLQTPPCVENHRSRFRGRERDLNDTLLFLLKNLVRFYLTSWVISDCLLQLHRTSDWGSVSWKTDPEISWDTLETGRHQETLTCTHRPGRPKEKVYRSDKKHHGRKYWIINNINNSCIILICY